MKGGDFKMKYKIRYVPKGKRKSVYLKSASGKVRTFKTKKSAERIKEIYKYKPKIRIYKY